MSNFKKYAPPTGLALAAGLSASTLAHAAETQPNVPNITLGDINDAGFAKFNKDFAKVKRQTGKGKRIYVRINSNGGYVHLGDKVMASLEASYKQGYNIRLVCEKAYSMAAVVFSGFSGNRFATKDCKFMTHASYYSKPNYVNLPNIFNFPGFGKNIRVQISNKIISYDHPEATAFEVAETLKTREDFATSLKNRSCRISLTKAFDYFLSKDTYLTPKQGLKLNIIDDIVKVDARGMYVIDYNYRPYKDNCRADKLNIVPKAAQYNKNNTSLLISGLY